MPALILALACLAGLTTSAALAQAPGEVASDPGEETGIDTEYTPVAKESQAWIRIGGAEFGEEEVPPDSPTPYTVDFFTVDFVAEDLGYAGGAACADPATPFEGLESCERVPVIWRYSVTDNIPRWEEVYRGTERGFVGAISFIDREHVLAVGGSGHYPRRELAREATESDADYAARDLAGTEENAAGAGRAWRLSGGGWEELADLPETDTGAPMVALTALECSPNPDDDGLCVAGGRQQLWHWQRHPTHPDGAFLESYTRESPPERFDDAQGFRFRVRDIRFSPFAQSAHSVWIVAVTSGCCAADATNNSPRVLLYQDGRWHARRLGEPDPTSGAGAVRPALPRQTIPDSYYAVTFSNTFPQKISVIATPGGPRGELPGGIESGEPSSNVFGGVVLRGVQECSPCSIFDSGDFLLNIPPDNPNLSTTRLHAADGDFGNSGQSFEGKLIGANPPAPNPDGFVDWAVGVSGASGQGIAYTTTAKGTPVSHPLDCGLLTASSACKPRELEEQERGRISQSLIELPSYALNGFRFVPASSIAWAVGDRGALLRLGGEGAVGAETAEPEPPRLGGRKRDEPADGSAYEPLRPPTAAKAGSVPALDSQPLERLKRPQLVPAGSPAPGSGGGEHPAEIVLSRDGSEGWAVGDPGGGLVLQHYDGGRWTRCDWRGIDGVVEPDPACADLGALRDKKTGRMPFRLQAAARVPLEADEDPTNDDEFEVVAVGTMFTPPGAKQAAHAVLRYADGEWRLDPAAMAAATKSLSQGIANLPSVAFTAPDDGWIVGTGGTGRANLLHFDGERWVDCADDEQACGDPDGRLPLASMRRDIGLTTAGTRVYLYGTRFVSGGTTGEDGVDAVTDRLPGSTVGTLYPFILRKDPGGPWTAEDGGYDPGFEGADEADRGQLDSLAVTRLPSGEHVGWASGRFGGDVVRSTADSWQADVRPVLGSAPGVLRLDDGSWQPWDVDDASVDYLPFDEAAVVSTVGPDGEERAILTPPLGTGRPGFPPLSYDAGEGRWKALSTPFVSRFKLQVIAVMGEASVTELAADNLGGFWLAASSLDPFNEDDFYYHYTDHVPAEVFEDAPHPVRERITALDATPEGDVWVTTASSAVYNYDRITGWERFSVPGWDPGRVITRASAANAVAVGPDGTGLVVGQDGRIAEIGPGGVRLDPAAGTVCDRAAVAAPCGTSRSLVAADIAPDGSAIVAGIGKALLWRPAGEGFRAITAPTAAPDATFTGVSMPSPDRAYLTTDAGQLWAGQLAGGGWSWRLESLGEGGVPLTLDEGRKPLALNAIAVDASGRGLAVGLKGLVLERTGDPDRPWRRLDLGVREDLWSVALAGREMGEGALIGGSLGLVLTLAEGRFQIAHRADLFDSRTNARQSNNAGRIVGIAAMPGVAAGQSEAWAAMQNPPLGPHRSPPPGALLHHSGAPAEPLLDAAGGRVAPLADAPTPRAGEVAFAAFGDSECNLSGHDTCPEPHGTNALHEVVTRRIAGEVAARAAQPGGPDFAVFTGDIAKAPGREKDFHESVVGGGIVNTSLNSPLDTNVTQRRWTELVAGDFAERGVPMFAALGGRDLAGVDSCRTNGCVGTRDGGGAGTSGPWRETMAGMPAPWGEGADTGHGSLAFVPVEGSGSEAPGGGARTHYAFDVVDTASGDRRLRVVVVDSSLRSLASSDVNQNPIEEQSSWLEEVLCRQGTAPECTRGAGEAAVVVSNTPTYSYGPGAVAETAGDGAQLEATLLDHEVSALVSGRLGWNGLYYALAPGVHSPEPGGDYPSETPQPLAPGGGVLPGVVAASAGGSFDPDGQGEGSASDGYWHGYSIVRVTGEPSETIVEQRPILDWIGIAANERVLSPRRRLALEGYGREALGTDTTIRYAEIDSAAITHRYDLLLADPDEPWLPCREGDPGCESLAANLSGGSEAAAASEPAENPCAPYLCLPERVGTVDRTTGDVRAGDGRYPQTFGLAMLSVGAKSATYPLVFEKSPSFVVKSALRTPGLPLAARGSAPAPPPPPDPPTPPRMPQIDVPAIPEPPAIPPMEAASPPEPQPPAPPAPPPPAEQPSPLDLSVAPTGLTLSTPAAVIQPPTPPVNPAPPSGARREARQRQAAAQKSGADAEAKEDVAGSDVDQATEKHALPGAEMTRIEHSFTATTRPRREPSFSAYRPAADSSPLGPGALYAGGLTLLAFALAAGWSRGRPTPRRREPELPAPAWASRRMDPVSYDRKETKETR